MLIRNTIAIFSMVLAGCASSGRIGDLPAVPDSTASSDLVLIRSSSVVGMTNSYYVALDGKDVFSIRSGENTKFRISTGNHIVAVKCFGGFTPTWKEAGESFVATKDSASYFQISPSFSCAKIAKINAEEAKSLLTDSRYVDPGKESGK